MRCNELLRKVYPMTRLFKMKRFKNKTVKKTGGPNMKDVANKVAMFGVKAMSKKKPTKK